MQDIYERKRREWWKMGFAKNVFTGIAITGAASVALAGIAVYNAGRYIKRMVYPPTVKKYVALAAIPLVLYAVRNPVKTVEGVGGFFSGTRHYASRAVEKYNDARVSSLQSDVEKLKEEKSGLEGLLKQKEVEIKIVGKNVRAAGKVEESESIMQQSLGLALENYMDYFSAAYKNALLVDARHNKIYLLNSNGEQFVKAAEYSCTTGKNPIPKQAPGDFATPEGIFFAELENAVGWSEKFTSQRLRIGIPKRLGAGILVTGSTDQAYLEAITDGVDVSHGGVVLSKPDIEELVSRIDFKANGNKVPLAIIFGSSSKLIDYTRGGH
jgi:hypothetical protein